MQLITRCYRSKLDTVRDSDIDRMMKSFQSKMKQRFRIPPTIMEKYNKEICFMVETNFTCMEVVTPRVKFNEPIGYEISVEVFEGLA